MTEPVTLYEKALALMGTGMNAQTAAFHVIRDEARPAIIRMYAEMQLASILDATTRLEDSIAEARRLHLMADAAQYAVEAVADPQQPDLVDPTGPASDVADELDATDGIDWSKLTEITDTEGVVLPLNDGRCYDQDHIEQAAQRAKDLFRRGGDQ